MTKTINVVIDLNNDKFPVDASPYSLTGINKLVVTNIKTNGVVIVMHLFDLDGNQNNVYILQDGVMINFLNPYPRIFSGVFFVTVQNSNNATATFDLELTY